MGFDDLVSPADVFLDANTLIYHFTTDFDRVPGITRYVPA